jgi:hypothetical protein
MSPEVIIRRRKVVVKAAGAVVGLFGLFIVVAVAWPVRNLAWRDDLLPSIFFMFAFPIPGVLLGCYCLFAACKTWRAADVSMEDVRRMSLVAAIVLALTVGVCAVVMVIGWGLEGLLGPLVMVVGGAIYLISVRWLAKWLGLSWETDWKRRERAARQYFWLLAFVSWSGACNVMLELVPKDEKYEHVPKQPWESIVLVGSLLFAVVLYYVCMHFALRGKPRDVGGDAELIVTRAR